MRVTSPRRPVAALASAALAAALLPLVAAAPAHAADATPERIVLTPPERPDVAQSFTWRTAATVTDGEVRVREVGTSDWTTHPARANEELTFAETPTRTHSATVTGLRPATEYEYVVGTEGSRSETYRFTTAAADGDPFTFIYFGDAQNDVAARWAPVVDQAYAAYPDAVGTVNAGDLINHADDDSEWTDWFGAMDGYSQTSNVIAAPGNHEYSGDEFLLNWKSNFEYDGNGPRAVPARDGSGAELRRAALEEHMAEAMRETVYYTDYQGVRFIALNATINRRLTTPDSLPPCVVGCPDPAQLWLDMQARWMDEILADNPNTWSVVTFHQPVFSTAVGRNEVAIRNAWLPVFQRNDVDLVLMGHDHTYARGYVNADATDTPGVTTGPVYAVSVSGPKYYEQQPADNNVWTQNGATQVVRAGHTSTFQGIRVDGDQMHYESIVAAKWDGEEASTTDVPIGGTLDEFTITKYDDGTKYVTEAGVPVPGPQGPGQPGDPGEPGEPTEEEPAEEPAAVPMGHAVVDEIESSALTGPGVSAVDPRTQRLYVAGEGPDGTGTVNAVDLTTGEVVDSFAVDAPIKDMSYVAGLDAVAVGWGDGTLNAFSVAPGSFGTAVEDDDIVVPYPLAGVAFDNWAEYIHYATQGAIVSFDLDGEVVAQTATPTNPGRLRIHSAGGALYATFPSDEDGTVGLRSYNAYDGLSLLEEYELDAGAVAVDVDTENGLVYVAHDSAEGGLSVIDLLAGTTTRVSGGEAAVPFRGVAVDGTRGLVYATSAEGADVTVFGRWQAPRITESPAPQTVDEGATATFSADAHAVPAATVAWESRAAGSTEWVAVEGADATTLEVLATAERDGTQYRAVFSNEMGGERYSTRSATATLSVTSDDEPGGEDPGGEDPDGEDPDGEDPDGEDPGRPTEPVGTPAPVDASGLTDEDRGGVTVSLSGDVATLTVGAERAGTWVGVYLHSTPTFLGWHLVDAEGRVRVTLPSGTTGSHRLVVLDADGALIGWAPVTLAAPGGGDGNGDDNGDDDGDGNDGNDNGDDDRGGDGNDNGDDDRGGAGGAGTGDDGTGHDAGGRHGLAATGADLPQRFALAALTLLVAGGALLTVRRRRVG